MERWLAVELTHYFCIYSGYVAVLGSGKAWEDGKLNPVEIAADPEASALTQTFKEQIAEQLGAYLSLFMAPLGFEKANQLTRWPFVLGTTLQAYPTKASTCSTCTPLELAADCWPVITVQHSSWGSSTYSASTESSVELLSICRISLERCCTL